MFKSIAFCFVLGGSCSVIATAALPEITAEAVDPVTPESMGGCSLKCAFKWAVTCVKKDDLHEAKIFVLNDSRASTVWRDDSGGIGTKLVFHFPEKLPEEMEGNVPFYGLDLINGDRRSAAQWKAGARVKKMRMSYNGKALYDLVFPDSDKWERLNFEDIMIRSGDQFSLEILEVYPGVSSATLAVSEVVLEGAH